jgi:hypothetical protein
MGQILTAVITTICTVLASLLVTLLFNKISGVPRKLAEEKRAREKRIADLEKKVDDNHIEITNKIEDNQVELTNKIGDAQTDFTDKIEELSDKINTRLEKVEDSTSHYPEYRSQSIQIQQQLQQSDLSILEMCSAIRDDVTANRNMLDSRLKSLENREKNALREKIYHLWRTFTDPYLNPMQAWTDMESHSFYELVKDYESLGGNDYVHKVILPAITKLAVVSMDDLAAAKELFESRNAKHNCVEK